MQQTIMQVGLPMFVTALGGSLAGGWLSMFCFIWSGAASRTIEENEQRKEAFQATVRQASGWAFRIGIVLGLLVAYIFVTRDPKSAVGNAQYAWVVLGSMGVGFVTASGFFGYFGSTGMTVTSNGIGESRPPHLTYPEHYEQTFLQAPDTKQRLTLIHSEADGPGIVLVYKWMAELSPEEADRLDTRARAYITCAIYDAATTAGLSCQPGPPHFQRPAWRFPGERVPVSLIYAGFDVSDKTCFMQIGSSMMMVKGPSDGGRYAKQLVRGFRAQFSEIIV
ncbi:MAG: hypothetical protein ACYC7E_08325 [Armatimonadota bacterium]